MYMYQFDRCYYKGNTQVYKDKDGKNMKEKYYFNPFVFIYEDEVGYIIQDGLNFKINLDKNKGSQLLKRVKENNGFTILELVDYFTENEIISLFSNNILIDYIPDTENRYSRNEGFFYTAKNIKGFSNLNHSQRNSARY